MSEYRPLGVNCTHCGNPLLGRPAKVQGGFVICGWEPMEYVHEDLDPLCPPVARRKAIPFSNIGMRKRWDEAARLDDEALEGKS